QNFTRPVHHLASDPNSSLREGDIVTISPGWRTSKHVRHVVTSIIAPFGPSISERPRVLTEAERLQIREAKREKKLERRMVKKGVSVKKKSMEEKVVAVEGEQ